MSVSLFGRAAAALVLAGALGLLAQAHLRGHTLMQGQGKTPVEGVDLRSRLEAALKLGRSQPRPGPFWAAYAFAARPGVSVTPNSVTLAANLGAGVETRRAALFLLYAPDGGAPEEVRIYDADRQQEVGGGPVYWLGQPDSGQSLELLGDLLGAAQKGSVAARLVDAVALHDDASVNERLKGLVRGQQSRAARLTSMTWFAELGGEQSFLEAVAFDDQAETALRREAISWLGHRGEAALVRLKELALNTEDARIAEAAITAISESGSPRAGSWLGEVVQAAKSPRVRKLARQELHQDQ